MQTIKEISYNKCWPWLIIFCRVAFVVCPKHSDCCYTIKISSPIHPSYLSTHTQACPPGTTNDTSWLGFRWFNCESRSCWQDSSTSLKANMVWRSITVTALIVLQILASNSGIHQCFKPESWLCFKLSQWARAIPCVLSYAAVMMESPSRILMVSTATWI